MLSNNKRIATNTIALYFRHICIMAVTIYTSRIILQVLGVEDYGIYNVVGGLVVLFSFITGTMASASQRFLSFEMPKNDELRLKKTFSLIFLSFIILSLLTVFLSETIIFKFKSEKWNSTYGSFCRIECAPIPYKHRHSERFKVLSCKIELFNSSIGHFAG